MNTPSQMCRPRYNPFKTTKWHTDLCMCFSYMTRGLNSAIFTGQNLTSCIYKPLNNPSTSCVYNTCANLSTSFQAVHNLVKIFAGFLQQVCHDTGCIGKYNRSSKCPVAPSIYSVIYTEIFLLQLESF